MKEPSLNDGNIGSMFCILLHVIGWRSTCYSTVPKHTMPLSFYSIKSPCIRDLVKVIRNENFHAWSIQSPIFGWSRFFSSKIYAFYDNERIRNREKCQKQKTLKKYL